jgi:hypothetical protein
MGLVGENVYLHDVQVSTCLIDAYEDYNCFSNVSFLCRRFQNEQRAAIKFCVRLKKTTLETSEMLKSV